MKEFGTHVNQYENSKDEMILRDFLATDRTLLANERTFLAYLRTFISFFAAGVGFIKFVDDNFIVLLGYILVVMSIFILIFGCMRYIKIKSLYKNIRH